MNIEIPLKRHIIPVAIAAVISLLVALVMVSLQMDIVLPMHFVFVLGGAFIGILTPQEEEDHRGTNGIAYLATTWLSYFMFSTHLFPEEAFLSDWVFNIMLRNIINGFAIMLGIYVGSRFQPQLLTALPGVLGYLQSFSEEANRPAETEEATVKQWENPWNKHD